MELQVNKKIFSVGRQSDAEGQLDQYQSIVVMQNIAEPSN